MKIVEDLIICSKSNRLLIIPIFYFLLQNKFNTTKQFMVIPDDKLKRSDYNIFVPIKHISIVPMTNVPNG